MNTKCENTIDTDVLVVWVTVPSSIVAKTFSKEIIAQRLAACVAILPPITSVYTWQGELETADEALLMIKTTQARYPALEAWVQANHPYDVPECIATPVVAGLPAYTQWVEEKTKQ